MAMLTQDLYHTPERSYRLSECRDSETIGMGHSTYTLHRGGVLGAEGQETASLQGVQAILRGWEVASGSSAVPRAVGALAQRCWPALPCPFPGGGAPHLLLRTWEGNSQTPGVPESSQPAQAWRC